MKILSTFVRRTKHLFEDPEYMLGKLICRIIPNRYIPDKLYLKVLFRGSMGYKLDLHHPKTFNEKLQWLKLHDRNPLYTTLVDKYRVKQWVADKIGEEYIIPTLAVYQSVDEIDLDKLPNQFVLKCNHDSGSVIICRDKATFDLEAAKAKLQKGLNTNYYDCWREWPYKDIKRCIIAEKYLSHKTQDVITDYKFFCFNGKPTFCQVIKDRQTLETIDFYDMQWIHQPFVGLNPQCKNATTIISRPFEYEKMIELSKQLSKGIKFVRVDFYEDNHQVYFGEMTFFPMAGLGKFTPDDWNLRIGKMIELSE